MDVASSHTLDGGGTQGAFPGAASEAAARYGPFRPTHTQPTSPQSMCTGPFGGAVGFSSSASGTIARNTNESTKNVSYTAIIAACFCTIP